MHGEQESPSFQDGCCKRQQRNALKRNCCGSASVYQIPVLQTEDDAAESVFHGEGDAYTHTQMVCRELIKNPSFYGLPNRKKTELFLAAILYDIGKVKTTRVRVVTGYRRITHLLVAGLRMTPLRDWHRLSWRDFSRIFLTLTE